MKGSEHKPCWFCDGQPDLLQANLAYQLDAICNFHLVKHIEDTNLRHHSLIEELEWRIFHE